MDIRPFETSDIDDLHRINEDNVPAVGSVTRDELVALLDQSFTTLVAVRDGQVGGFVLSLTEGQDYGSLNYGWISERYPGFAYVDRIAVDANFRSSGIGALLYEALAMEIGTSRPVLTCEVNTLPPNPGSLRFHKRLGFEEVGEQTFVPGEKAVVYLAKTLSGK